MRTDTTFMSQGSCRGPNVVQLFLAANAVTNWNDEEAVKLRSRLTRICCCCNVLEQCAHHALINVPVSDPRFLGNMIPSQRKRLRVAYRRARGYG